MTTISISFSLVLLLSSRARRLLVLMYCFSSFNKAGDGVKQLLSSSVQSDKTEPEPLLSLKVRGRAMAALKNLWRIRRRHATDCRNGSGERTVFVALRAYAHDRLASANSEREANNQCS